MKITKKCENTKQNNESIKEKLYKRRYNKRRSSAGMFYTSSAGAVTSLILMATLSFLSSVFCNLSGLTGSTDAYATSSTITVNITTDITLDLSPIKASGTFATSDTSANNVSVKTDNGTGYTLGIKASVDNNNTLSTTGGASIPSHTITTGVSESNYEDDTYAEANNLNNTWGYRPSKLNSVSNSNYLPGPTSASTVIELDKTNVANASTFNNYNLAIGARVDTATVPGEYSNVFVFTVVANPAVYSITYNKNTTDTVTNMPANVVNQQTSDETVTLDSAVPVRDGYNFKGWCTTQVADNGTCSGATYNAGGTWTLDQTLATNSLSVYAIWKEPEPLYNLVAEMSKGKNTAASSGFSWTSITKPTSTNPSEDTSTSGVFEWDGTDSNGGSEKVYFYRGILDTTLATYGSNGLADAYPNYVKLSNGTCWRIVRTTSTGGVKMVYNGTWGDTTADSCANTQQKAQTRYNGANLTVPFNTSSSSKAGKTYTGLQYQNIHAVGYTYTNSVPASTTSTKTPAELFGASGNDTTTNNQSSIMKQYVEDWYAGIMTSYTSKLEGDAGFCQDRRLNTSTTWTTPLAEDSNTIIPYGTSGMTQYYFGAYPRNTQASTFNPLLTCPRGKVDLYSYTSNAGNGNGQLTYPVALLTADEASLAGDGWNNSFSAYNANSFLRSGSLFWLLSPYYRRSNGGARGFYLYSNGNLSDGGVSGANGVRPAISLASGTVVASGSGTATDPWIVNP